MENGYNYFEEEYNKKHKKIINKEIKNVEELNNTLKEIGIINKLLDVLKFNKIKNDNGKQNKE